MNDRPDETPDRAHPEPEDQPMDTDSTHDRPVEETAPLPTHDEPSGRHPLNVAHLVMGIAFLGFVAVWAAIAADAVDSDDVRWLLPVPWVLAGAAGLLAITFGGRRSRVDQGR